MYIYIYIYNYAFIYSCLFAAQRERDKARGWDRELQEPGLSYLSAQFRSRNYS